MRGRAPLVEALRTLLGFLDRKDIAYMLMGGLAVRTLAIPRPTFDLDLTIAVDEAGAAEFARGAESEGFSAEDLLLHKLLADRPRDRADIADLLLVMGGLDEDYLRTWAGRLGLRDRLGEALRAADRWLPTC